jgi:hypothetical protein
MTQFMKEVILWFSSIFLGTCIVFSNDCTTYHYVCTILLCFDWGGAQDIRVTILELQIVCVLQLFSV